MGAIAPRVSVIVPFFNAQLFLQRCVDSLNRQTLDDLEILVVDDGSTDHSRAIAATIAAADPRVIVLEQSHIGPGAARNRGLDAARAPYVTFVDSDDELTPGACASQLRRAHESGADIVVAKMRASRRPAVPSGLDAHPARAVRGLYAGRVSMSACAKLYRRSFLEAHRVRFPPALYIEDRHFLLQCLTAGASLASLEEVLYRRHVRPGSTMHAVGAKHLMDATAAYELDAALLDRAGLLATCGLQAAWATLVVDLYLARAVAGDASLRNRLTHELARQESLFRLLPGSRARRALVAGVARRLRRDLARAATLWPTRAWLRLVKVLAL